MMHGQLPSIIPWILACYHPPRLDTIASTLLKYDLDDNASIYMDVEAIRDERVNLDGTLLVAQSNFTAHGPRSIPKAVQQQISVIRLLISADNDSSIAYLSRSNVTFARTDGACTPLYHTVSSTLIFVG